MRVLLVHNHYQQPGGEDQVFAAEGHLLEAQGHRVLRYTSHNDQLVKTSLPAMARDTVWNGSVYRQLRDLIRRERPQVAHFHNTFPIISPAAYYAARAEGVPIVQTLHNYRLLCPNALFFREGRVCEDCMGKAVPWPGVVHGCYQGSRIKSGAVAAMLTAHRSLGTWTKVVDVYIALTKFAQRKFIQGGLPEEKIMIKPNFVSPDPGIGKGGGGYALFAGRLSEEKGIATLLAAWKRIGGGMPLKIAGDGPLAPEVSKAAERLKGVEWLGMQPRDKLVEIMKGAQVLIVPSEWYEGGFPMVIAEAFAVGLPVIASDIGNTSSLIDDGHTGLHFRPGDPGSLADRVAWVWDHPEEGERMRGETRAKFEAKYTGERNHRLMMEIYQAAIERAKA